LSPTHGDGKDLDVYLGGGFGKTFLGDAGTSAPAPVTPQQIAFSETPVPIPVYVVQCQLNKATPPARLTVDGVWGSKTDAALRAWMSTAPRPRAGMLAYDTPLNGAQTISMTPTLALSLPQVGDCTPPAAMMGTSTPSPTAPSSSMVVTPPPSTSRGTIAAWLIGIAAVVALGGIGWVLWKRRAPLKRRIKG
jgi:hypothetical protein